MNYENLLEIPSVGCVVDLEEQIVYPLFENGAIDLGNGVDIAEVDDEWFASLSEYDLNQLIEKGIYQILK